MTLFLMSQNYITVHSYSFFLWAKGVKPANIYREMCSLYGEKCTSRPAIHCLCIKFAR